VPLALWRVGPLANAPEDEMVDAHASTEPLRWGTPASRWVLAATVGGSTLALVDATSVNVALPTIAADLGASVAGLQWIVNGYALALAALILLAGSLADRFGRRRIFLVGVAWFGVASLLCAVAPSTGVLVAARVLQGIGGALLTPGSLAIIQASFAPGDRARAIGAWSGLGAVAGAVGPLIGGWLIAAVGWRAIFWTNLPVVVLVLWVTARHVPESDAGQAGTRFDLPGATLATTGLAALTWALIAGGAGTAPLLAWAAAGLGLVSLAAFLVVQARSRAPMLPLTLFRSRQFTGANLVTFVVYGGMGLVFFLLMVQLQTVLGLSPLAAGAALLPVTVCMALFSARAGAFAERFGPRAPMTAGPLVMAAGLVWLSLLGTESDVLRDVLPAVTVFAVGLTAMVAPLTATVLAAAGEGRAGTASGINNAVARTASLLAVAAIPGLVGLGGADALDPTTFSRGFAAAMRIAAACMAAGGALAFLLIQDRLPGGRNASPVSEVPGPRRCPVDGAPLQPHESGAV
jgi:EmrB/QacA subfamily drug resistance transporter